jgi:hypothetical protein
MWSCLVTATLAFSAVKDTYSQEDLQGGV